MENNLTDFLKVQVRKQFRTPIGLLSAILLSLLLLFSFHDKLELLDDHPFTVGLFNCICIFLYWLRQRNKLPRSRKDSYGVLFCIEHEEEETENRIKNDICLQLKDLLRSNRLSGEIDITYTERSHSKIVINALTDYKSSDKNTVKKTADLFKRSGASLIIYGRILRRQQSGEVYFIKLDVISNHEPLREDTSVLFGEEISRNWESEHIIKKSHELAEFREFSGELSISINTILGHVAFLAGKLDHSLKFFLFSYNKLMESGTGRNNTAAHRLGIFIAKAYTRLAYDYYTNDNYDGAIDYCHTSLEYSPMYESYLLLASCHYYLSDLQKSLDYTMLAKKHAGNSGAWRYSLAFLQLCFGNNEEAEKQYKLIGSKKYDREEQNVTEVIEFIDKEIKRGNEFAEVYYVLGYLNYKKLGNLTQALLHLERYLKLLEKEKRRGLYRGASLLLSKIKKEMELEE